MAVVKELIKIQRPLSTNGDYNTVLIYNKSRSIEFAHTFTDKEMVSIFRQGECKAYFNADFDGATFSMSVRAEEQDW